MSPWRWGCLRHRLFRKHDSTLTSLCRWLDLQIRDQMASVWQVVPDTKRCEQLFPPCSGQQFNSLKHERESARRTFSAKPQGTGHNSHPIREIPLTTRVNDRQLGGQIRRNRAGSCFLPFPPPVLGQHTSCQLEKCLGAGLGHGSHHLPLAIARVPAQANIGRFPRLQGRIFIGYRGRLQCSMFHRGTSAIKVIIRHFKVVPFLRH